MDTNSGSVRTILHVIDALNIGGAQALLELLAAKTPRSRYRTLVCVLQPDMTVLSRIEATGIKVFCLNRRRPGIVRPIDFISYFYLNIRDITRICGQYQVDVIHCHLSDAEFIGILAGYCCRVKRIVSTVHYPALLPERKSGDIRNYLRIRTTRWLYCLADTVIAVSDDVAEKLHMVFGLSLSRIRVIINGIDVDAIYHTQPNADLLKSLYVTSGQRLITSVGRLMPPKGHRYLIEAMPAIHRQYPNARLILAGDGDLRKPLEARARELGVQDAVSFLGSRSDIADILAVTEIFVLPSISEGTSLALLEAMSAAKPIVATDIPGNSAVLRHATNCLLVPPADPDKLADAIVQLLKDPPAAAHYGQNAYQDACRRYHIDQTISRLMEIWG
jgi:glycosyltransferase involved in cell wall biosynthesis